MFLFSNVHKPQTVPRRLQHSEYYLAFHAAKERHLDFIVSESKRHRFFSQLNSFLTDILLRVKESITGEAEMPISPPTGASAHQSAASGLQPPVFKLENILKQP